MLLHKMKHDPDFYNTSELYDPLSLLTSIDRKILAETKDQYCYATVYDQECAFYGFNQQNLTNEQYYDQFNTRVDVGEDICITIQHCSIMEDTAQESYKRGFTTLFHIKNWKLERTPRICTSNTCFFGKLESEIKKLNWTFKNDFTTGDEFYPKNR